MRVPVEQVNALTGEIMEGAALALIFPKRRNGFQQGGWVAMGQDPMGELARANLGGEAYRVLFLLLARLDFENWLALSQAEVAQILGMRRQNVGRAFQQLVDSGALLRGPKAGRNGTWRINPHYGWKGSAKGHHEALSERMKAARMTLFKGGAETPSEPE